MASIVRKAALGLAATGPGALAWWDNGHMLTAQVAKQLLQPEEVQKLDVVLGAWEADFPRASDMVATAVWPDLIKCTRQSAYCNKPLPDSLEEFEAWHFSDRPFNPDNLPLSLLQTATEDSDPSATWMLAQAMQTFENSKTRFAFNLMLRFAIHVVGDLHQPMHAVQGFFNDSTFGHLPNGDRGGNSIPIVSPPGVEATNLHALWDSGAGLYLFNWPFDDEHKAALASNASDLLKDFPGSALPEYKSDDIEQCVKSMHGHRNSCAQVFQRWANETHSLAVTEAYGHGMAAHTQPSAEYIANAQTVARRQIALGGQRLADLLRAVVPKLPPSALSEAEVRSPPSFATGYTGLEAILASVCAVLSLLVVVLLAALRGGKEAQRRTLQQQLLAEGELAPHATGSLC